MSASEPGATVPLRGNNPKIFAGDVEMNVHCLAAGTLQGTHSIAAALVQHVADRDLGAGFDHQLRSLCADPPRST